MSLELDFLCHCSGRYGGAGIAKALQNPSLNPNYQFPDFYNYSGIHFAVKEDREQALKILLNDARIDPNLKTAHLFTPFHIAVIRGHTKCIDLFLRCERVILDPLPIIKRGFFSDWKKQSVDPYDINVHRKLVKYSHSVPAKHFVNWMNVLRCYFQNMNTNFEERIQLPNRPAEEIISLIEEHSQLIALMKDLDKIVSLRAATYAVLAAYMVEGCLALQPSPSLASSKTDVESQEAKNRRFLWIMSQLNHDTHGIIANMLVESANPIIAGNVFRNAERGLQQEEAKAMGPSSAPKTLLKGVNLSVQKLATNLAKACSAYSARR